MGEGVKDVEGQDGSGVLLGGCAVFCGAVWCCLVLCDVCV